MDAVVETILAGLCCIVTVSPQTSRNLIWADLRSRKAEETAGQMDSWSFMNFCNAVSSLVIRCVIQAGKRSPAGTDYKRASRALRTLRYSLSKLGVKSESDKHFSIS